MAPAPGVDFASFTTATKKIVINSQLEFLSKMNKVKMF